MGELYETIKSMKEVDMKAIMIVSLDDSFIPLNEDTINRNPFAITIEGLKLKTYATKT